MIPNSGAHAGLNGAFWLLKRDNGHKVVYLENLTSSLFLEEPEEIEIIRESHSASGPTRVACGRIGRSDHRTGASMGDRVNWRKSSYSGTQENCVEVALTTTQAGVRDSKHPSGPALSFSLSAFKAFLTRAKF